MKIITGFPNYKITKDGRIWSIPRRGSSKNGKWMKVHKRYKKSNHLTVRLCKNGKMYNKSVHRLVLEVYVSPCPDNMECRHLDGNPQNNNLDNLCWGTKAENSKDAVKHGTIPLLKMIGEQHPFSKLKDEDVRMIVYMYRTGEFTQQEIADIYNIAISNVNTIIHKKAWKHIWKG